MFRLLRSTLLSLLLIGLSAWGVPAGDQPAGEVKALIPDASRNAHPLVVKDTLQWNDLLKTDAKGRLRVGLTDGSILSVGSSSELKVVQHDASAQQTVIEMNYGKLRNQVVKITNPGGKYEVKTPNAVAGVIGTDFYVAYDDNQTTIICFEGKITITSRACAAESGNGNANKGASGGTSDTLALPAGQMIVIGAKQGPNGCQTVASPPVIVQTSLSETDVTEPPAGSQAGLPGSQGKVPSPFDIVSEKQLWQLVNQERTTRGLPALHEDTGLTQAARKHDVIMAQNRVLSHQFPGEPPLEVRITAEKVRFDQTSENVATAMDAPTAHRALMASPQHRAAILDPGLDAAGIAATWNGKYVYVTETFAHVLPNNADIDAGSILQDSIARFAASHGFPAPTAKPEPRLQEMARSMALNGAPDAAAPRQIDDVGRVLIWTTSDPTHLPRNVIEAISQPLPGGYSVGAYFAASAKYPQGIYWVVMITY
ncbi:MAG: FecR domain-containing protein [Candidatus Korobacteraceae bacterium]|jgi:uncharacterized protein YkwD